jgi:hypothetical protein
MHIRPGPRSPSALPLELRHLPPRASLSRRAEEPPVHAIFARPGALSAADVTSAPPAVRR